MPDTRVSSGAEAVLTSTPTALTQSSTTASRERDSFTSVTSCWYWPTPIDLGSILTSSASGSCSRRAIDTAPRSETSRSGSSFAGVGRGGVHRRAGLGNDDLGQAEVGVAAASGRRPACRSPGRRCRCRWPPAPRRGPGPGGPAGRSTRPTAGGVRGGRSCRWPPPCRSGRRRPPSRRSAARGRAPWWPGCPAGAARSRSRRLAAKTPTAPSSASWRSRLRTSMPRWTEIRVFHAHRTVSPSQGSAARCRRARRRSGRRSGPRSRRARPGRRRRRGPPPSRPGTGPGSGATAAS